MFYVKMWLIDVQKKAIFKFVVILFSVLIFGDGKVYERNVFTIKDKTIFYYLINILCVITKSIRNVRPGEPPASHYDSAANDVAALPNEIAEKRISESET